MCLKIKDGHGFAPDPNARPIDPEAAARLRTIKGTRAVADEMGLSVQARDKAARSLAHSQAAAAGSVAGVGDDLGASLMGTFWKRESGIPKDQDPNKIIYSPAAPGTKLLFEDTKKEVENMMPEERERWFAEREERRRKEEEEKIKRWNEEREARASGKAPEGMTNAGERRILQAAANFVGAIARA